MKRLIWTLLLLILVFVLAATITARLGYWPVAASAMPSRIESTFADSALRASLARQAADLKNPLPPTTEVLSAGRKIFSDNCAGCHGKAGQPSQWGTQNFYPRVPQFGDHPPDLNASQMFVAIKYGIRYSGMGGWDGMMPDEKIWQVATFLEHIKSLPPEVQATPTPAQ